jgi:hypothetical protein
MRLRRLLRAALHLLLIAGLVLPGIAAPAQGATQALATAASGGKAMTHAPCDGMQDPMQDAAHGRLPAGAQHGCDLSACLGSGCLPSLPHVAAFIPEAGSLVAWDQPMSPSRHLETPLRPPIA